MSLLMFSYAKETEIKSSSNETIVSKNLKVFYPYMEYKLGMLSLRDQYLPQNRTGSAPTEPGNDNDLDLDKQKIAEVDVKGTVSQYLLRIACLYRVYIQV